MTSLQHRLTASLWLATIGVGIVVIAVVYWRALDDSRSDFDNQMLQIARFASAGTPFVNASADTLASADDEPEDRISVIARDAAGKLVYSSGTELSLPTPDWTGFRNLSVGGIKYRVLSASSAQFHVVVAQTEAAQRDAALEAAQSAAAPVAILIPIFGLVIGFVVRRQLKPVAQLAVDVAARTALSLEPLPEYEVPTEIRPLVVEIDRLLLRQRAAMEREHQFIVDAAHAIRTPLAALQLQSDILDGSADATERARRLADLKGGIRRTAHLSNQLLALADGAEQSPRAGIGASLDESLANIHRLYLPIAADRNIRLTLDMCAGLSASGTSREHALIFGNLIDNALRYTGSGNSVAIVAVASGAQARIRIEDEGPGLPESEIPRVVDRFYRLPGDDTEGSGLGLSVVRAVVQRLGGAFELRNRPDRSGLIAEVTLKRAV